MRGFMVLCFIAVASAGQLPGYNYQQPSGSASNNYGSVGAGHGGHGGHGAHGGHSGFGGHGGSSGVFGGGAAAPAVWNKQYFIHSAPEDALDGSSSDNNQVSLKKNLRVVFIKAPENKGLENAALQLAKSASEDKTAIYVLNRQTDLAELQNKLSQIQDVNANKPEVHFVKYKTPEEAEHAQHTIQAQYDQFQGPTSVSNEGIAPVQNFVGSAGGSRGGFGNGNGGFGGSNGGFTGGNGGFGGFGSSSNNGGQFASPNANYLPPNQNYLPPTIRF